MKEPGYDLPVSWMLVLVAALLIVLTATGRGLAKRQPPPAATLPSIPAVRAVNLHERLSDLIIHRDQDSFRVVLSNGGGQYKLTPEAYIRLVHARQEQQRSGGYLFVLFNITSVYGVLWVGLGLLGQLLFTGRILIQWVASEKRQRSVMPVAFWWLSLFGASMLIIYFIWRKDIVGILGQSTGWVVYLRNLTFIYRTKVA